MSESFFLTEHQHTPDLKFSSDKVHMTEFIVKLWRNRKSEETLTGRDKLLEESWIIRLSLVKFKSLI